jgi:hypothetical protein
MTLSRGEILVTSGTITTGEGAVLPGMIVTVTFRLDPKPETLRNRDVYNKQ